MKAFLLTLLGAPTLLLAQTPAPTPAAADAPKLTADQVASIMKQLDDVEGKFNKSRGEAIGTALARFRTATASEKDALDLYIACYKTEHFDKLNLKQADFLEWRQRNDERFRDTGFLYAIWLQARYLAISLQAQDAKDSKDMGTLVTALQSFIPDLIKEIQSTVVHTTTGAVKDNDKKKPVMPAHGGGAKPFDSDQIMNMLHESVKDSEFSKGFQLKDYLVREDWEYAPLDIESIYNLVIFPYYLEGKPSEIPTQWDLLIRSMFALKQATFTDTEYQTYYKDRYPEMLWSKAQYMLDKNVNPILAMADMLKIVRDNPQHPKAGEWIKELRENVNKAQPGVPPTPGT